MQELRTIKLIGAAGRKFGREFCLAVNSPAEAFRALCVLCPGLRGWVLDQHEQGVAWRVVTDQPKGLSEEELDRETGVETIVFAPIMRGAGGNGGIGQIILGIALIAVAIAVPAATFGLKSMLTVGVLGGGLVLSGIATLLTPTPTLPKQAKTGEQTDEELKSNLFTRGATNGAQGEVVPVLYGKRLVPAPRIVSFELKLLPKSRSVNTSSVGLLGYINRQAL